MGLFLLDLTPLTLAEDSLPPPEPLLLSPLLPHSLQLPVIFLTKIAAEPSQTDFHTDHRAELELVAMEPLTVLLLWNVAVVHSLLPSPPVPKQSVMRAY